LAIELVDYNFTICNIYLPSHDSTLSKNENATKLIKVLSFYKCHVGSVNNLLTGGDFNSDIFDKNYRSDIISKYIGNPQLASDFKFYKKAIILMKVL